MLKKGVVSKGKNEHHIFAVQYTNPVEFTAQGVELDPYVLGVLLGDSCMSENTITFTNFDKSITDYVSAHLPQGDVCYCQDEKKQRYMIRSENRKYDSRGYLLKFSTVEILDKLGLMGKLSYDKFIPDCYLYNSADVRMAILSGLLDIDGYCDKKGIEFSTTSKRLKDNVIFLVRSLGGKATYKLNKTANYEFVKWQLVGDKTTFYEPMTEYSYSGTENFEVIAIWEPWTNEH